MQIDARLPQMNVSINLATPKDIAQLREEMSDFYSDLSNKPLNKNEFVFIARDPKQKTSKILGFVKGRIIHEGEEKIGEILVVSVRKGFKGKSIGPKLLGKANSYFIAKRIKRAELVSFNNEFYMKRSNYRARATDADDLESSIKILEAHLKVKKHRRTTNPIKSKSSIAPQNLLNKDSWIRRRIK